MIPILKPIAKAGLKSVKEQGLEAIKDIASGQNVKQVLKRRGTSAAKSTLNRLVQMKPIKKAAKKKNYRHIKCSQQQQQKEIIMQNGSCECSKSELDRHSVPPTMTTMQDSQWMNYHPIASLDSYQAPIEFVVPSHTEYYTDLSQSYLFLKCRILKPDGSNVDSGKKVSPVNNFFHSMFSSIDLYVNNKLVTSNMDTYPYRAYLENLFSYGSDVKDNQLKAGEFWYEDEPDKFDNLTHANVKARAKPVAGSKSLELQGRLHLVLVLQEKYLPNGLEFKLKLNSASPQFSIMSDTPVVLKIDCAIFSVRYLQLLPALANDLNQSIARSPAKFQIRRAEVKTFTIGTGLRSKIEDHLLQGQLPKRVFIGMISNEAFNGSYDTNPFNFTHFDLSKLEVTCYGHNVYGRAFEPNFDDDLYLRSYLSLFQALNSPTQMQNCNIDIETIRAVIVCGGSTSHQIREPTREPTRDTYIL